MINSHVFPIGFQHFGISLICLVAAAAATPSLLAEPLWESGPGLSPAELRCEYRANPLGIDVSWPRLSWIVTSAERGQRQTEYQVLVASSNADLMLDQGDLWDSGQVKSDDTTAIVYGGKPLSSNQPCSWKVKVWDKDGKPSTWSSPAIWSMGLLEPSDWKGEWIGHDRPRETTTSDPASGGAIPESAKLVLPPPSYLRLTFQVRKPVKRATVYSTALGIYDLHLNGKRVSDEYFNPGWTDYTRRVYYRAYDVTNRLHAGITPWARSWPMAGTAATSATASCATITASTRGSKVNSTSSTPTAASKSWRPGQTGRRRPARSSRPISSCAKPMTRERPFLAGTALGSTIPGGRQSSRAPRSNPWSRRTRDRPFVPLRSSGPKR